MRRRKVYSEKEEEEIYSYSWDTVEEPRPPTVKLMAHHSSLTRGRAASLSPVSMHFKGHNGATQKTASMATDAVLTEEW